MPRLVRRVDEVLELPYITETQAVDIELIGKRVGDSALRDQRRRSMPTSYDRLIASTNRFREEIRAGDAALDRLLKEAALS